MRSSIRILYVDDDKDSCDLADALLKYEDLHCTVISTESAREARLLIVKEHFDLYIFNRRMPEISGVELCRCVRQFDSMTPVLFFSAAPQPVDAAGETAAGVNEYIIKPNDLKELSTTVKRLLDESSPAQGRQSALSLRPQSERFTGIGSETIGKKFNQNQIRRDAGGKMRVRSVLMGAAIFAVIVLHFVSQFVFIQNEKIASETETGDKQIVKIKPEIEQRAKAEPENEARSGAENKPKYEARSSDTETTPDAAPPESKIAPSRTVIKKKESGESKAERLRRAERILTGV